MTMEDDFREEGARPSSLIPVHKLATRDPLHDMQLLRDVAIINERVRRELGPALQERDRGLKGRNEYKEGDALNLRAMSSAMALGVLASGGVTDSDAVAKPASVEGAASPRFRPYASVRLGGEAKCVVGAVSDGDGMNQRPRVRVSDGDVELWVKDIGISSEYYGGRATHCLRRGGSLYVLVQIDTQSQQSLSQTLLEVVRLNYLNGGSEGSKELGISEASGAYTSWVPKGMDNFYSTGDAIVISGKYRLLDAEEIRAFSMTVDFQPR